MSKSSDYYIFRYFIIPYKQMTIDQLLVHDKKDLIMNIFEELAKKHKMQALDRNRKYYLYHTTKFSKNLYLSKFARETYKKTHELGEYDIEEREKPDYPYVYMISNLHQQIIFVQKNTSIFRNVDVCRDKLKNWFKGFLNHYGYIFEIEKMTYTQGFWEAIDNFSGKIHRIDLLLNSPNLFGAGSDTDSQLKMLKNKINNTQMQISYINNDGSLIFPKEEFADPVKYISNGGGKWSLKYSVSKKNLEIKSEDNTKMTQLPDDLDNITPDIIQLIKEKFKEVDEILQVDIDTDL